MAFANKYRILFKDVEGVSCYIYIQEDSYGGAIIDLTPGKDPLEMAFSCSDKNQSIVGSSATIRVVYESAVDDLFTEAEHALRVYIDTTDFDWYGFIVPFQYSKKLSGRPQYATFIATDQLGMLSEKKFEDSSGDPVFYVKTDMEIIQAISDQAALDLSMRESVNVYEDSFDSDAEDSPLTQVYSHAGQYWDEVTDERTDCHTVLTDVLRKYGARICQWDLEWWIQRPQTLWSDHTTRHHNSAGGYLAEDTEYRIWNKQTQGGRWRADPTITKLPRAGRVELMAEPRRLDNLFKNSTFDDFTQYTSGVQKLRYITADNNADVYDGYVDCGVDYDGVGGTSPTAALTASIKMANVSSVQLVIDFESTWHSTNTYANLNFKITSTLTGDSYMNSGWTSAGSGLYTFDVYAAAGGTSMTESGTFTLDVPNPGGLNGFDKDTLTVVIYNMITSDNITDASYYIYNARLEAVYQSASSLSWPYSMDNDVTSYRTIKDSLRQVDAERDQYVFDYKTINGIYPFDSHYYLQKSTTDYDNTSEWFIKGHPGTVAGLQSIQQMLCRQLLEGSFLPTDQIQGSLLGRYNYTKALVDDDLKDPYGFAKTFIGQNLTWNVHRLEWTGTWIEIAPVYTDVTDSYDGVNYGSTSITDNEISVNYQTTTGTDYARTDPYTAVAGEMLRIVVTLTNDGGSALPNYEFDGNTGELEWGANYLEFRCDTAGSYYLEINHTDGEVAYFTATYDMYSLTGI